MLRLRLDRTTLVMSVPARARSLPVATVATAAMTASLLAVALLASGDSDNRGGDGVAGAGAAICGERAAAAPRALRGMWITTVGNSDWPSRPGLDPEAARAEYREWLDLARRLNFNAVFVQVRPSGDAFWPSKYVPWSQWLTGRTDGRDPGWDPMAFLVSETHRAGLEFHAWFNPYRASRSATDREAFPEGHPLRSHPEWAVAFPPSGESAKLYYNPGIPEARRYVEDSILEAVSKYDVDGVHFDDFFYPYPVKGVEFNDTAAFERWGGGFASRADWRRDNVNQLVREMSERVKKLKPWVKFGISPFGIWRNAETDPLGSDTRGLQAYDDIYADSRRWVREQWLDYIVPQLYWNVGFAIADYAKLVPWWSSVVAGTRVRLYIGQADYRVGAAGAWSDPGELDRQLALNLHHAVSGSVHFTARDLRANKLGAISKYVANHHAGPALPPVMTWLPARVPGAPTLVEARADGDGAARLSWRPARGVPAVNHAVYRMEIAPGGSASASGATAPTVVAPPALVWVGRRVGRGEQRWVDQGAVRGRSYLYCVTGLDRVWNEGPASSPKRLA